MNHHLIPFAIAKTLFEVAPSFYAKLGIKAVISDLDNTLDAFDVLEPSEPVYQLKKTLDSLGITFYIGSNNSSKRVHHYADLLGVKCVSGLLKPFSWRLQKFLRTENLDPSAVLMVGDQIMTDVKSANGAGVKILLTERLTDRDHCFTWLNRHLEKPLRRRIVGRHLAPDWRELA